MDGGPGGEVGTRTAVRVEGADGDQVVEDGGEYAERRLVLVPPGHPPGQRQAHAEAPEQPLLLHGEGEVGLADGDQPADGQLGGVVRGAGRPGRQGGDGGLHVVGEPAESSILDRVLQGLLVVEVPVGGCGRHPDPAGDLAQHHRVRPALRGQVDPLGDQRLGQVAVVVSAGAPVRSWARVRGCAGPVHAVIVRRPGR